jgi:2-polyprenyl-6-methoxyphenol hydroxylase-like FAD-dependent oxidoreductase
MDGARSDTDVLIVGAGPVGLATALELGLHGVSCLLVDRRDGTSIVPKTTMVSARNMEFCRRWGIAPQVRNKVWDEDRQLDFVYCESLAGAEIARARTPCYREQRVSAPSPEVSTHCPQLYFDPMLKARADREKKVSSRYATELLAFAQDDSGVSATLLRGGEPISLRCRYLVACDGAAGVVRDQLGIGLEGRGDLARSVNVFFESPDLVGRHDKGWARIYRMIDESGCWSELIPIDGERLWRLTVFDEPGDPPSAETYLARAFGAAWPARVIDMSLWRRRDYVARAYQAGRVFLAGDSAHQCSPTSGLGMATGLEDAVNLAWKIAAALQGWGGPGLLASYKAERRPIGLRNVALSTQAFDAIRAIPSRGVNESGRSWRENLAKYSTPEFVKLHYVYEASPICLPDAPDERAATTPFAQPGARAPHVWLGPERSALDLFGPRFTLRALEDGADPAPLSEALARRGAPVRVVHVASPEMAQAYGCALALVRPDGHVAWRGARAQEAQARFIAERACGC